MFNHFHSFGCLPFTIFSQRLTIPGLILMSTALQPSSACSINAGVDFP